MPVNTMWLKIDGEHAVDALQEALAKLDGAGGELALDFSAVQRVDPAALRVMETLAGTASEKGVKVVLHGVNVDVYKTLKLTRLAPRFSFV